MKGKERAAAPEKREAHKIGKERMLKAAAL